MSVNSFILVFDKGSAFTEKYFGFPAREDHKYQVHLYVSGGFLGYYVPYNMFISS